MTQHILTIWMASAVAAFFALVGCTTRDAASAAPSSRGVQVTGLLSALLDNALRALGVLKPRDTGQLTAALQIASPAQSGAEFDAAHAGIAATVDGVVMRKPAEADEVVQPGQTVLVLGGVNRTFTVEVQIDARGARFALIPAQALLKANDKEAGVFMLDERRRSYIASAFK